MFIYNICNFLTLLLLLIFKDIFDYIIISVMLLGFKVLINIVGLHRIWYLCQTVIFHFSFWGSSLTDFSAFVFCLTLWPISIRISACWISYPWTKACYYLFGITICHINSWRRFRGHIMVSLLSRPVCQDTAHVPDRFWSLLAMAYIYIRDKCLSYRNWAGKFIIFNLVVNLSN